MTQAPSPKRTARQAAAAKADELRLASVLQTLVEHNLCRQIVRTARWALRHRRHIRFVLREVLLAMDAVYYLERLVEIAEQSYEVVRRRTILDRSEAATIKRRVRARLRVARMMTKLSLPDRAAPAVVTPSTPAVAPSAAKGAFERVDDSE